MEFKKYIEEKAELARQNRFLRFIVFIIAVAIVINGVYVYRAAISQRVVLVPLGLTKEVYVTGNEASQEYLSELTYLFISLLYQYTPSTASSQFETALKFAHPSFYPELQRILYRRLKEINDLQITATFLIEKLEIRPQERRIKVTGTYTERIGAHSPVSTKKEIELNYDISSGRFYITNIKIS
ncbi:MAG: TraE/TraK family type IV conjugative transfer system protein [Caldisericum sp.]